MKYFFTFLFLLFVSIIYSQNIDIANYHKQFQLNNKKTKNVIKIDGELNEAEWQSSEKATNFWLKFPKDDTLAKNQTEVRVCYDDKNIYFGIKIFDSKPLIGNSLKRDSRIRESDGIGIVLDPMNKKASGFYFSVTAFNVQADDVISNPDDDLSFSWDNKWYSATKRYATYYTIEIAIPFKTLHYDKNNTEWGINFIRSERNANEFHTWTRVPVNFRAYDIGYTGALIWDAPPPSVGSNKILIPYINQTINSTNETGNKISGKLNAGFDAKIAVTDALNLDVTVNPDFSQADADVQVTNLTRFDLFYPEKRNFFLENADLFSSYGIPPIRPFYSRRIGIDANGNALPILAGLRLTGNISNKTRIGIMNIQTNATNNSAAQNYTAIAAHQRVLKRSTIKAYVLNRTGFYTEKNKLVNAIDKYGRNAGTELSYSNEKGTYNAWLGLNHSFKPNITTKNNYILFGYNYNGRKYGSLTNFDFVGLNYYTDMGFIERINTYYGNTDSVIRNGFRSVFNQESLNIYPKKSKTITQHKFTLETFYVLNSNNTFNERNNSFKYQINFKKSSFVEFTYDNNTVQLLQPTVFTSGDALPPGKYNYGQAGFMFETDSRKQIVFGGKVVKGNFFNGTFDQLIAKITLRKQPKFTLELKGEYDFINLASPYGSAKLFLISPRIEINFATNLFWTTFIQYNTQANNINFNSRLQWRYKPVSDLFLVYTDNYYTNPLFNNKNRSIVLKVNYWLNL